MTVTTPNTPQDYPCIVRGNDFNLKVPVYIQTGVDENNNPICKPFDLTATDISVVVKSSLNRYSFPFLVSGNEISIAINGKEIQNGSYGIEIKLFKTSNIRSFSPAKFRIVESDAEANITKGVDTISLSAVAMIDYGSGINNYEMAFNKPSINGVELLGNKSLSQLGVQQVGDYPTRTEMQNSVAEANSYTDNQVAALPTWVKQPQKPVYTAAEVGALPNTTIIPTQVSQLTNDSRFLVTETDPTVPAWAKQPQKPTYTANEVGAATTGYVDQKVAAIPTPDVSGQIATHNASASAHTDIRATLDKKIEVSEYTGGVENVETIAAKAYKDGDGNVIKDSYQRKLSAGNGIAITNNVISATGGGSGGTGGIADVIVNDLSAVNEGIAYIEVPTKISELINDGGYLSTETDPVYLADKPLIALKSELPNLSLYETKANAATAYQPKGSYLSAETDPTVPAWAKQPNKPTYTAAEVGAATVSYVDQKVAEAGTGDLSEYAKRSDIPSKISQLTNDRNYLTAETDPTVPAWAKQPQKPTYTANEVGALPSNTQLFSGDYADLTGTPTIPTKVSELSNDSGFLITETDPVYLADKPLIALKSELPNLAIYETKANATATYQPKGAYLTTETDPTVPTWAKQSTKPVYTAAEVGALPSSTPLFSGNYNDLTNKPAITPANDWNWKDISGWSGVVSYLYGSNNELELLTPLTEQITMGSYYIVLFDITKNNDSGIFFIAKNESFYYADPNHFVTGENVDETTGDTFTYTEGILGGMQCNYPISLGGSGGLRCGLQYFQSINKATGEKIEALLPYIETVDQTLLTDAVITIHRIYKKV